MLAIGESHLSRRSRYFTPREANSLLQQLVPLVLRAKEVLARGRDLMSTDQHDEVEGVYAEVRGVLAGIREHGVEIKGLEPALLDFPALRYGKEVYLCWREGEVEITTWHPISTGIAGRQALDETEPGAWEWCN